jgi:hypothetical protein
LTIRTAIALGIGVVSGYVLAGQLPAEAVATQEQRLAPCSWPASLDAVVAAPKNHRVVLENEHVRVLDVTVAPGEREPLHAHCRSSVMYVIQEGVYRDYDAKGRVVEDVTVAPPPSRFPMTLWLGPQAPHSVHNRDSRPTRLLRVELKR